CRWCWPVGASPADGFTALPMPMPLIPKTVPSITVTCSPASTVAWAWTRIPSCPTRRAGRCGSAMVRSSRRCSVDARAVPIRSAQHANANDAKDLQRERDVMRKPPLGTASLICVGLLAVAVLLWPPEQRRADAYVDVPPTSLGALCEHSTHII